MGGEKTKTDLLPGTLDMLVLKCLLRGHLHGYAIARLLQQLPGDRCVSRKVPSTRPCSGSNERLDSR